MLSGTIKRFSPEGGRISTKVGPLAAYAIKGSGLLKVRSRNSHQRSGESKPVMLSESMRDIECRMEIQRWHDSAWHSNNCLSYCSSQLVFGEMFCCMEEIDIYPRWQSRIHGDVEEKGSSKQHLERLYTGLLQDNMNKKGRRSRKLNQKL